MNLLTKKQYITIISVVLCLIVYLLRINGYVLMDSLSEAKYVVSVSDVHNLREILLPLANGVFFIDIGVIYSLIIKFSASLFGGMTEFAVRIPEVFIVFLTLLTSFFVIKNLTTAKMAFVSTSMLFGSMAFVVYSSITSPYMFSACFLIISVLLSFYLIVSCENENKKYFYLLFWVAVLLTVFTGKLSNIFLVSAIILPFIADKEKFKSFIKPINFFPGFLLFLFFSALYLYKGFTVYSSEFSGFLLYSLKPAVADYLAENSYLHCLKEITIPFLLGLLPWLFSFVFLVPKILVKIIRTIFDKDFSLLTLPNEELFFHLMLWASFCSLGYAFIWGTGDFAPLIFAIFFISLTISYYWYKNIEENKYKKSVWISSLIFYIILILLAIIAIFSNLFITEAQKIYIEPLVIPVSVVALLVAIPGSVSLFLKRRLLNFSIHLFFSVLLFFLSTGMVYNYINSFGENDLINCALKAKQDNAILATYDIKNQYLLSYYYGSQVIFNGSINAEQINNNYGNDRNVYIVLKHKDLAYFDKFFVYEIVATGKQYCEITNIKYLPNDEVEQDTLQTEE